MNTLKERILSLRSSVPTEMVDVPGVGMVEVRGLTAAGRDEWEQRIYNAKGKTLSNMRASLVALCLFEDGKRIFEANDVSALGELPASVVDHLWEVSAKLSGLGANDKDELEKNSESARTA